MLVRSRNAVQDIRYQHNLLWSLKPVVYLLQVSGIDLNPSREPSICCRVFCPLFAFLVAVFSFSTTGFSILKKSESPTSLLSLKFKALRFSSILFQLQFLLFVRFSCKSVWKMAQDMADKFHYETPFYLKLRKVAAILTAIALVSVPPPFLSPTIS